MITSKHTEPDASSMFGWYILFLKPIDGDLYGYNSGRPTLTVHVPPSYKESWGPSNRTSNS